MLIWFSVPWNIVLKSIPKFIMSDKLNWVKYLWRGIFITYKLVLYCERIFISFHNIISRWGRILCLNFTPLYQHIFFIRNICHTIYNEWINFFGILLGCFSRFFYIHNIPTIPNIENWMIMIILPLFLILGLICTAVYQIYFNC